jgi:hypothetical protein
VHPLSRNVPVDSPNWDMSEQLIALEARKNAMTAYTDDLFLGAQQAHQALWPGQTTPTDPADLGNDLQLSKVRVGNGGTPGHGLEPMKPSPTSYPGMRKLILRLCALCAKGPCGPQTRSLSSGVRS